MPQFHAMNINEVLKYFDVDYKTGLTEEQIEK